MDPEKEHSTPTSNINYDEELHSKEDIAMSPPRSASIDTEADDEDHEQEQTQPGTLSKATTLEHRVSLPREIFVVALIVLAQLMTQVGLGQTVAILHVIGDRWNITNPGILSWLIAGYSLTVGTFILFTGRLGDLFGWKKMLVIGYVWFGIWSMVAGLSWYSSTHVLFVFARVFQGIGPAIVLPNGLALLGGLYQPGKRKNLAFAVFGACAPVGSILGSVFAALSALDWWPWTFFSFAIVLFVTPIAAQFLIPDPQDEKPGIKGKGIKNALLEMDLPGAVTGITALVLFNFAWNQAPIVGWGEAYIIVTLILGVLLVPVFFYIEIELSPHPFLPFDVFTASNAFVLACMACGWANFGIWFYYLWSFLEVVRGISPLLASAYVSPVTVAGTIAAITTTVVLRKLRPAYVMMIAMTAFTIGAILIATCPPHQIYWGQIFFATIIAPFGMDLSFPSATLVISDSVKKAHQGVAASLVNTVVNYSISLGLGFAGTIEVHVNHGGLTLGDTLYGYRAALYMGVGLAGLGVFLSMAFAVKTYWDERRDAQRQKREGSETVT